MSLLSSKPNYSAKARPSRPARLLCAAFLCCAVFAFNSAAAQQLFGSEDKSVPASVLEGKPESPGKVEVRPVAKDDEIRQRIADILVATSWFGEPKVTVQEGIVFLKGTTENDEFRQWAGDLAKNTEGVVAVVNQIEVAPTTVWDFEPSFRVLNDLARGRECPEFCVQGGLKFHCLRSDFTPCVS